MATPNSDLLSAIQNATSDTTLQEALLFGAYGESGWAPNSGTPAAGGYWGFTAPYYDSATLWDAPASQQVAAILPSYQNQEQNIPSNLSGAAAAEYLALGAEAPAFSTPATIKAYPTTVQGGTEYQLGYSYTPGVPIPPGGISEQEVIAQTGQTTQYGANAGFDPSGLYSTITNALGVPNGQGSNLNGSGIPFITPTIPQPGVGSLGPVTSNPNFVQNYPTNETLSQADATAQAALYSNPTTQQGFANQTAAALTQTMQPPITAQKKDSSGNVISAATGYAKDALNILTFGAVPQAGGPVHLVANVGQTDVDAVSAITGDPAANIWNVIKSSMVRLGIGLVGLLFLAAGLYIIVQKVSGGVPVPIPV